MDVNIFGLGINSDDVRPFFGSDFHMPVRWKAGAGKLPRRAKRGNDICPLWRLCHTGNGEIQGPLEARTQN